MRRSNIWASRTSLRTSPSPGGRSRLVPGVAVFVIASKHDDGTLTSTRLFAEKDGQPVYPRSEGLITRRDRRSAARPPDGRLPQEELPSAPAAKHFAGLGDGTAMKWM